MFSHALSVCSRLTLANKLYCTVQYIMKALDSNLSSPENQRVLHKENASNAADTRGFKLWIAWDIFLRLQDGKINA